MFVKWGKTDKVFSESLHQYGSATTQPKSVHYNDQSKLFVLGQMKPTWREKGEIINNREAVYSPGKTHEKY